MGTYACPHCERPMVIERVHEGHAVPCPHCERALRIPEGASSGPPELAGSRVTANTAFTVSVTSVVLVFLCGASLGPVAVLPALLGPIGWYLGHQCRLRAKREGREVEALAWAAIVLGILSTVALAIGGLFAVVMLFATGALRLP